MTLVEMNLLVAALLDGDSAAAVVEAKRLVDAGTGVEGIVRDGVQAAMNQLDNKCTVEQFNLLEIMLVGRAVMDVMNCVYPAGAPPGMAKGSIVIATLEGDVHDLGKNILKMVLTGKGYRVVDCGKDCPVPQLVETVAAESPLAIGISGLITTIIPRVKQVRPGLDARGLAHVPILAGGAALKQALPEQLNVDYVAESAFDGARYLDRLSAGGVQ